MINYIDLYIGSDWFGNILVVLSKEGRYIGLAFLTMFWLFYRKRVVVNLCHKVSDVMLMRQSCEIHVVVALDGLIIFDVLSAFLSDCAIAM